MAYGLDLAASRQRKNYYYNYLREMCGPEIEFCEGTQFQTRSAYIEHLFNWQRVATVAEVKAALPSSVAKSLKCATTVKAEREKETAAEIIYTITQIIDIE